MEAFTVLGGRKCISSKLRLYTDSTQLLRDSSRNLSFY